MSVRIQCGFRRGVRYPRLDDLHARPTGDQQRREEVAQVRGIGTCPATPSRAFGRPPWRGVPPVECSGASGRREVLSQTSLSRSFVVVSVCHGLPASVLSHGVCPARHLSSRTAQATRQRDRLLDKRDGDDQPPRVVVAAASLTPTDPRILQRQPSEESAEGGNVTGLPPPGVDQLFSPSSRAGPPVLSTRSVVTPGRWGDWSSTCTCAFPAMSFMPHAFP
jgi:hypothetical protein